MTDVAALVHRETGQRPSAGAARASMTRTAGNPFFVRELSRLLADGGALTAAAVARAEVPATVRDVVRDRMADLDDDASVLLRIAALVGRDVDLGLLARVADVDVQTCLDRLEPLEALGLLGPTPGDPYSFRFAHDLVRESVSETMPPRRASPLHLRVADALERHRPRRRVRRRSASPITCGLPALSPTRPAPRPHWSAPVAERQPSRPSRPPNDSCRSAAQLARTADLAELELSALSQLTAVVGMRSCTAPTRLDLLERAEHLARGLGRDREADRLPLLPLGGSRPGPRAGSQRPVGAPAARSGRRRRPNRSMRAYGMFAWGIHQWDVGNIGEAFRYLSQAIEAVIGRLPAA